MAWFVEALSVLVGQWSALLRLLAVFGVGMILLFGLLRRVLGEQADTPETWLLALAGWPSWWVFGAFGAMFIDQYFALGPVWAPLLVAVGGLALIPGWKKLPMPFGKLSWMALAVFGLFLLSLFTRLAFLADLLVPSYFDGALHYSLSQHLLTEFGVWPWEAIPALGGKYYHVGFHLLAAVSAFLTGLEISQVILLLGQVWLAVLPFPVFVIIRRVTGSNLAAFGAFLLAGWGWNMPVHALDWGKYPALAGLLALQFVLALALFAPRVAPGLRSRLMFGLVLGIGIGLAGLFHSRAVIVIGLALLSYWAAGRWERWPRMVKWLAFTGVLGGLGGLVAYIQSRDVLNLVFDPYLKTGLWMTLLVTALSPLAFWHRARLALSSLLSIILLLACLLIPLSADSFQTLLDRPFVQMTLYLPLALLGGLGLAGLRSESFKGWQVALATVAVFSAVLVHVGRDYPFSPSSCCIQFTADDAVAMDWMKKHLPPETQILIAGNNLVVFDTAQPTGQRGSDGGIWITPLVGFRTITRHYGTDFSAAATFDALCELGVTHIYLGGTRESFNLTGLQARPDWYAWQFSLPGACLFRITGCR